MPVPRAMKVLCWAFIFNKFRVLMVGLYPGDLLWRPLLAGGIFVALAAVTVLRLMKPGILISLWFFVAGCCLLADRRRSWPHNGGPVSLGRPYAEFGTGHYRCSDFTSTRNSVCAWTPV